MCACVCVNTQDQKVDRIIEFLEAPKQLSEKDLAAKVRAMNLTHTHTHTHTHTCCLYRGVRCEPGTTWAPSV